MKIFILELTKMNNAKNGCMIKVLEKANVIGFVCSGAFNITMKREGVMFTELLWSSVNSIEVAKQLVLLLEINCNDVGEPMCCRPASSISSYKTLLVIDVSPIYYHHTTLANDLIHL